MSSTYLTLTCMAHKTKLSFPAACCSLADGSHYWSLFSIPEGARVLFRVQSVVGAGRVVARGNQVKTEEKLN